MALPTVWRNGVLVDQQGGSVTQQDAVDVLGTDAANKMAARQEQRAHLRSLRGAGSDAEADADAAPTDCSAGCCSSVGLFLAAYAISMTLSAIAVATATTALSTTLRLLAMAVAPPLAIIVFLVRTFHTSIDRMQVALTFCTAVLWMAPLLALIYGVLAPLGLLRAIYSLDPTCAECFESVSEFAKPCPAFGFLTSDDATKDRCCLPDVTNSSHYHTWPTSSSTDGTCSLPLGLDADPPTAWTCSCHWRNIVMAFFRAAFLEETLKFLAVATIYTKDYVADPSALVLYAIAGACGFALRRPAAWRRQKSRT
jgi:hypothetical protein